MLNRLNIKQVRVGQWRSWTSFLILFFLFSILAGVIQARGLAKKGVAQEVSKEEILAAERRLADLGYWMGPVDGTLDSSSRHALIAFQKVEGRQRTGKLKRDELQALLSANRPLPKYSGYAHVEIDLKRQVLFIVDTTGTITHTFFLFAPATRKLIWTTAKFIEHIRQEGDLESCERLPAGG
jgi:peptidoglycan hydrolase-like protein with peptidoglycan-binding domain